MLRPRREHEDANASSRLHWTQVIVRRFQRNEAKILDWKPYQSANIDPDLGDRNDPVVSFNARHQRQQKRD